MENNDTDLFDRYLHRKMEEAEQHKFEARLQAEPALREALQLQQLARDAVRLDGRAELKQRLRKRHPAQPSGHFLKKWCWPAGALLLLVALFFWWKKEPAPAPDLSPEQQQPTVPSAPKPPVAETAPEKMPENSLTKPGADKLFAANFRAFQSEEISGMLRAEDAPDAFQQFLAAYLRGQHGEVLRLFALLSEEDKANENILFLKANSLLAQGRAGEAEPVLEKICLEKNTHFLAAAQWYLALAYLKTGKNREAEMTLNFIKTANGHPFAAQASQILKDYSTSTKPAQ